MAARAQTEMIEQTSKME